MADREEVPRTAVWEEAAPSGEVREVDLLVAESMSCPLTIQVGAEQNSKKAETNNIINLRAKESDASLMSKQCPICKSPMHRSGKIKQKNPLTNRIRMVQVYYCNRCGYRTLG